MRKQSENQLHTTGSNCKYTQQSTHSQNL